MHARRMVLGLLVLICVAGVAGLTLVPALAQAASARLPEAAQPYDLGALPPRPTPELCEPAAPVGALIRLEISFGAGWPSQGLAWQDLWTAVEWQDAAGDWHTVEGWQGGIDSVASGEAAKTWWLTPELLGRGPFRWVVTGARGGTVLATSDAFNLPAYDGGIETVALSLE